MHGRWATLLAIVLLAPALAGCASEETPTSTSSGGPEGGAPRVDPTTAAIAPPTPKSTSQRWHFHDYWMGNPVITLVDANVTLNLTQDARGVPALSALVALPSGKIVPAETGFLTINVTWASNVPGGAVNVTYRPSDSLDYQILGDVANGKPAVLFTTESMCDVPHRSESFWRFNLTAVPNGTPPTLPPRDVRLTITATIGRPLFIDPPHLDWWQGEDAIPLVAGAKGEIATAATRAANLTLVGGAPPSAAPQPARIPVDAGRIVPEGAVTIVAMLNWTSEVPGAKPGLRYREGNLPSEGALTVAKDGDRSRVFVLDVRPAQTDTTYSNRTTWEFHVVPDGGSEGAFRGSFTLVAWVTRLSQAEAAKAVAG